MGNFLGSAQVRTTDRDRVKAAATQLAQDGTRFLLSPADNGWVGLYPENNGQDPTVSQALSALLPDLHVLHLLVHDDDIFLYHLCRDGTLADAFDSCPDYFGSMAGAEESDPATTAGNPEAFRPILGDRVSELAPLLARDGQYVFESERLAKVADLLGIRHAGQAYEYLLEEPDEAEGFEPIPPEK